MITNGQIEPSAHYVLTPTETDAHQRLDSYLTAQFPHYSRTFFHKIIKDGLISRNGIPVTKPSTPVLPIDTFTIIFPAERFLEPETIIEHTLGVAIIAKTDHFMIISKPAHLLVHAPSKTSTAITLTDWILHNHADLAHIGIIDRPGIIHRLDKETSGVMVLTRTNYAHSVFGAHFKDRTIHKTYHALVTGHPTPEGTVSYAIGRDPVNRIRMAYFDESHINKVGKTKIRHATTHYKVIHYFQDTALIELKPITGRTHQIRIHMAAIGHPIVGDQLYGKPSSLIDRQALHAHTLSFTFDNTPYSFSVDLPEDFQNLLRNQKPFLSE